MTAEQLQAQYPFLRGDDLKAAAHVSGMIDNTNPRAMRVLEDIVKSSLLAKGFPPNQRKRLILSYAKAVLENQIQISKDNHLLDSN